MRIHLNKRGLTLYKDFPLNHPANLPAIAGALAARLGTHPADLARQTTANARAFFRLPAT